MTKQSLHEKQESIRANVFVDRAWRAARWVAFALLLICLVGPLVWRAYVDAGLAVACAVLLLCMALCWHVKPQGRSYGARVADIERRYPKE